MRIALIYHQFVPRGGLEGYLLDFAARLHTAGHDLHLVGGDIKEGLARSLDATIHHIPLVKGSSLLRMWQFEQSARALVSDLEVDVSIGFGRTTSHDLHRAGGGCHAVYSQLLPPWKKWAPKNLLELRLERELYTGGNTKRFIVNSSQVAAQLHDHYGTDGSLFRVIHTAVDTDRYQPSHRKKVLREKICELLKTDAERPVFLFVSLSHRRKGLDVLLDMWADVDADLWIVGQPLNYLHRMTIAARRIQGKVRTISPQSDMSVLYQAADWFIHPTLYDACANTVLQSMACGLPGLISVNDGAIDLVRDGENGFLLKEPTEPAAVLETVKRALASGEEGRQRLGEAARETMLPLTWDAHLRKWLDVIAEVAPQTA
ncbi:MAG TPA: glycosyltransferase family 4 protein [Candidatus Saccharimonadia bacterium]|nr:glycosyltransferase family 4 protein [Candidatus Saccharimonadia bacterium]